MFRRALHVLAGRGPDLQLHRAHNEGVLLHQFQPDLLPRVPTLLPQEQRHGTLRVQHPGVPHHVRVLLHPLKLLLLLQVQHRGLRVLLLTMHPQPLQRHKLLRRGTVLEQVLLQRMP